MRWQDARSRATWIEEILFLPASTETVSRDEIEALEVKRIRRLRELGKWRPSRGWRIEPVLPAEAPGEANEPSTG